MMILDIAELIYKCLARMPYNERGMASKGLREIPVMVHEKLKRATNLRKAQKPLLAIPLVMLRYFFIALQIHTLLNQQSRLLLISLI